jgi:hypothetical protein
VAPKVRPTPLQSVSRRSGLPCPKAGTTSRELAGSSGSLTSAALGRSLGARRSADVRVVDRWPFPLAHLGLLAASVEVAWTCVGLPFQPRQGSGDLQPDPRDLRLSFGDSFRIVRSFSFASRALRIVRSGDHSFVRARSGQDRDSSLGVVNYRPSIDLPAQRPLPVVFWLRRASRRPVFRRIRGFEIRSRPSARSCHTSNTFRPCRSSRLRRFAPLDRSQVCCTLQPTMGFATFQVSMPCLSAPLRGEVPRAR